MEGSVPSSFATSTHVSLGMHCVRCHSSSMAGVQDKTSLSTMATHTTSSRRCYVLNLSVSPDCRTRPRIAWSGGSREKLQTRGFPAVAVAGGTSTTSSRESLPTSATPPGWKLSAPSSPTASAPGDWQEAFVFVSVHVRLISRDLTKTADHFQPRMHLIVCSVWTGCVLAQSEISLVSYKTHFAQ